MLSNLVRIFLIFNQKKTFICKSQMPRKNMKIVFMNKNKSIDLIKQFSVKTQKQNIYENTKRLIKDFKMKQLKELEHLMNGKDKPITISNLKQQGSKHYPINICLLDLPTTIKIQRFKITIFQVMVRIFQAIFKEKFDHIQYLINQTSFINKNQSQQSISTMIKKLIIVSLIFMVCLSKVHPHLDPIISHVPLTYKVNLEDSPTVRWQQILRDFKKPLDNFMKYFDLLPIPKSFFAEVQWYAKNQFKYQDFVAEVDAIAKLSGYPFQKIFFINFMYQYSTIKACTGIIIRNDEGKIIHGRNLDFSMWELLAALIANIEYYKDGKLLFTADTVVGSVFTLTANKPGAFSVEVNTRTQAKFDQDFINVLIKNAIPTCWLLRKVVETENTYSGAVARLKSQRIGGPVYFVVSGLSGNEGIIIERDNEKVHASYQLTDSVWYLVQTNYDRDQPDPSGDYRRIPAEKKLQQIGNKGLKEQKLFDNLMSQFPTLNLETIMTVVMVSASGYHNTTVWYSQNPKPSSQLTEE